MNPCIIRLRAIAILFLLCLMLWPTATSAGDPIESPLQDLLPVEPTMSMARMTQRHVNSISTAHGLTLSAVGRSKHLLLYQCRYDPIDWSGDVIAYLAQWENGRLMLGALQWRAAEQFQFPGLDWRARRIVTYGGKGNEYQGVPFRWDDLSVRQQIQLIGDMEAENPDPSKGRELVAYLRGKPSVSFRQRKSQLGDIMNSLPVLAGRTLFVGANDGMLHAFDAFTGRERFAYVPNLVFGRLRQLGSFDYHQQPRYYVDAAPTVGHVLVSPRQRCTYLIGGLGRGGRGYYCLQIGSAEQEQTAQGTSTIFNEYGGEASEEVLSRLVRWEYPAVDTADDAMDNDGDGIVDEPGEFDPHLGYSFSQAYAVNANAPSGIHRPVVIFGNGYNSSEGQAVLYVLEAHSGRILRKIYTGADGRNGLSTPALIDVDLDRRIDYAYAGDLKGNLWKFDLTAADPAKWGVAFPARVGDRPQPLIQIDGLSITGRPDVMAVNPVCNPDATGVMVIFGTGAHQGFGSDQTRPNAIFGIWDNGVPIDLSQHDLPQGAASRSHKGQLDHVAGWSVQLTSASSAPNQSEERVTGTVAIRGGRAVVTSYIPGAFPGSAHGSGSRIYVLDACTGTPVCNVDDTTGYPIAFSHGLSSNPVILKNPSQPHTDYFLTWDSKGRIVQTTFAGERQGKVYWRQNF